VDGARGCSVAFESLDDTTGVTIAKRPADLAGVTVAG
jgi:hypothetical protein